MHTSLSKARPETEYQQINFNLKALDPL